MPCSDRSNDVCIALTLTSDSFSPRSVEVWFTVCDVLPVPLILSFSVLVDVSLVSPDAMVSGEGAIGRLSTNKLVSTFGVGGMPL